MLYISIWLINRYHRSLAAIARKCVVQDSSSGYNVTSMSKKKKGASTKDNIKDVAKADVVGAGTGAIAGGVTASFTTTVVRTVDAIVGWLF